jgi:HSP20 family protein
MQTQTSPAAPRTAATLAPAVDIAEDAAGITLTADLPGVKREDLTIGIEGKTLTISAPLSLGESDSLVAVYTEIRANQYHRVFELSSELDSSAIQATLSDGVLTLRIPKLERAKPRRIEVSVG